MDTGIPDYQNVEILSIHVISLHLFFQHSALLVLVPVLYHTVNGNEILYAKETEDTIHSMVRRTNDNSLCLHYDDG